MNHRSRGSIAAWMRHWLWAASLLAIAAAAGCQGDASSSGKLQESSPPPPLAIIGTYTDEFGTQQDITATQWKASDSFGTSTFAILSYDNAASFLIAQNGAANAFFPNLYSRFDWTTFNSDLYVCQTVYNGASVALAQAGVADRANPSAGGCDATNNFPWTNFTPPPGP
jgi:hypothetical protein